MKIKSTISTPRITPGREIANSGNFRGYQIYSRGLLRVHDDKDGFQLQLLLCLSAKKFATKISIIYSNR